MSKTNWDMESSIAMEQVGRLIGPKEGRKIVKELKNLERENSHLRKGKIDWRLEVQCVRSHMKRLKRKPNRLKLKAIFLAPGPILNALLEGDLTFKQAVKMLEGWKKESALKKKKK